MIAERDEYDFDSSDEEDIRNTVGNIPLDWYKIYDHVGRTTEGEKIQKSSNFTTSFTDDLLAQIDDPEYWRKVRDPQTGEQIKLTDEVITILKKHRGLKASEDNYEDWTYSFTDEVMETPVTSHPPQKRSFQPSKWERLQVSRMVHAIKMGWMKPAQIKAKCLDDESDLIFDVWGQDTSQENEFTQVFKRPKQYMRPPKEPLPSHAYSYNPPLEYLLTPEEQEQWEQEEEEGDFTNPHRLKLIPKRHDCLRHVSAYPGFIADRVSRCQALFEAPRVTQERVVMTPEQLLPKLPDLSTLKPFPMYEARVFSTPNCVTCLCVSPCGQWCVTGYDDKQEGEDESYVLGLWEISTGRCVASLPKKKLIGIITGNCGVSKVVWIPTRAALSLFAVLIGEFIFLINPGKGDRLLVSKTDSQLQSWKQVLHSNDNSSGNNNKAASTCASWQILQFSTSQKGVSSNGTFGRYLSIKHDIPNVNSLLHLSWQTQGDYMAVVACNSSNKNSNCHIILHQLSQLKSDLPFGNSNSTDQKSSSVSAVISVEFHPTQPVLFVTGGDGKIRLYDLVKRQLIKTLKTNCNAVSSMAVHASGSHVLVGSFDGKLNWFDLDLSTTPFKSMSPHDSKAIRQVCYHNTHQLFASCGDNASIMIGHHGVTAANSNDLDCNVSLIFVKQLRAAKLIKTRPDGSAYKISQTTASEQQRIITCGFHPQLAWIVSAWCSNNSVRDFRVRLHV